MPRLLCEHADGRAAEPARKIGGELGSGDTPDPVGPEETRHGPLMLPGRTDRVADGVAPGGLVDVRSTEHEDRVVELVHVYESADPIRGLLVQGLLESDGIEVFAKGEGTGPYRTGPVILFVDEADRDRALELIAAAQDGSLSLGLDEDLARETRTD